MMKKSLLFGTLIGAVFLFLGCINTAQPRILGDRHTTKNTSTKLDGIWQSDGYGFVLDINNGEVTGYDATRDICVPFGEEPFPVSDIYGEYQFSHDSNEITFFETNQIYPYNYIRLTDLPSACQTLKVDTPFSNFDAFVSYFNEHYAFFDLYNVDWATSTKTARKQISDKTTDAELFEIFKMLLTPIQDAHVNIYANLEDGNKRWNANPEKMALYIDNRAELEGISLGKSAARFYNGYWINNIGTNLLQGKGVLAANSRIQYGMASDSIGYIAILNEGSFTDTRFDSNVAALDNAMVGFMALLEKNSAETVIIDLSVNFGGRGKIAREIASRFAESETIAYSKYAKDSTARSEISYSITPHENERFTGPVFLVTSHTTLSAGEELTLALRALGNVIHIGESTRGALSDKLNKSLPNGWEVTLSNEVYIDQHGKIWEGRGIEPEKKYIVFNPNSPLESHLNLIRTLISEING